MNNHPQILQEESESSIFDFEIVLFSPCIHNIQVFIHALKEQLEFQENEMDLHQSYLYPVSCGKTLEIVPSVEMLYSNIIQLPVLHEINPSIGRRQISGFSRNTYPLGALFLLDVGQEGSLDEMLEYLGTSMARPFNTLNYRAIIIAGFRTSNKSTVSYEEASQKFGELSQFLVPCYYFEVDLKTMFNISDMLNFMAKELQVAVEYQIQQMMNDWLRIYRLNWLIIAIVLSLELCNCTALYKIMKTDDWQGPSLNLCTILIEIISRAGTLIYLIKSDWLEIVYRMFFIINYTMRLAFTLWFLFGVCYLIISMIFSTEWMITLYLMLLNFAISLILCNLGWQLYKVSERFRLLCHWGVPMFPGYRLN
ncbi:hypothetical protein FGO68_gene13727 [Halteria grandinella]|uniref:Uncharacterized protein n=1 Tax=Halteria grandinella TaxID=5974 RepID=A0A8J8T106_HALGN|nr:hypothetical protein FGO68_gene13727 [Halteria grandinella]